MPFTSISYQPLVQFFLVLCFYLLTFNSNSAPSEAAINKVINRSNKGVINDCYYFNQLYKQCESSEEVFSVSKGLKSSIKSVEDKIRNSIATARRLSSLGEHRQAIEVLHTFYPSLNEYRSSSIIPEYNHTLGHIAMNSGNPKIALKYYKKAASLSEEGENGILYQSHLISIGVAYNALLQAEEANAYFQRALELELNGENRNSLYLRLNIALTLLNMGDLEMAKSEFLHTLPIVKAKNDSYAEIRSYGNLAEIYLKQDSVLKSIHYFEKARELALNKNQQLELIRIDMGLSQAYESQKNTVKSLFYLKSATEIESAYNQGISATLTALELENEIEAERIKTASALEQRNRESRLKRWLLIAFSAVLVFAIILVAYILQLRRKKRHLLKKEIRNTRKSEKIESTQFTGIIQSLESCMEEDLLFREQGITLDEMAKKIGTNRTYLSEAINAYYQQTFTSWLNGYRIAHAKSLLIDPKFNHMSIEGIAQTAGFSSISTFNAQFKSNTGLTPSYFRKNGIRTAP